MSKTYRLWLGIAEIERDTIKFIKSPIKKTLVVIEL